LSGSIWFINNFTPFRCNPKVTHYLKKTANSVTRFLTDYLALGFAQLSALFLRYAATTFAY
jgi:hypothetical protein